MTVELPVAAVLQDAFGRAQAGAVAVIHVRTAPR